MKNSISETERKQGDEDIIVLQGHELMYGRTETPHAAMNNAHTNCDSTNIGTGRTERQPVVHARPTNKAGNHKETLIDEYEDSFDHLDKVSGNLIRQLSVNASVEEEKLKQSNNAYVAHPEATEPCKMSSGKGKSTIPLENLKPDQYVTPSMYTASDENQNESCLYGFATSLNNSEDNSLNFSIPPESNDISKFDALCLPIDSDEVKEVPTGDEMGENIVSYDTFATDNLYGESGGNEFSEDGNEIVITVMDNVNPNFDDTEENMSGLSCINVGGSDCYYLNESNEAALDSVVTELMKTSEELTESAVSELIEKTAENFNTEGALAALNVSEQMDYAQMNNILRPQLEYDGLPNRMNANSFNGLPNRREIPHTDSGGAGGMSEKGAACGTNDDGSRSVRFFTGNPDNHLGVTTTRPFRRMADNAANSRQGAAINGRKPASKPIIKVKDENGDIYDDPTPYQTYKDYKGNVYSYNPRTREFDLEIRKGVVSKSAGMAGKQPMIRTIERGETVSAHNSGGMIGSTSHTGTAPAACSSKSHSGAGNKEEPVAQRTSQERVVLTKLAEFGNAREAMLLDMKTGKFGRTPRIMRVYDDGTMIDVSKWFKKYRPPNLYKKH